RVSVFIVPPFTLPSQAFGNGRARTRSVSAAFLLSGTASTRSSVRSAQRSFEGTGRYGPLAQRKADCHRPAGLARFGFMTPVEVAEGVFLLALPLGIHRIPSINAYLFTDPAGDTLIDCG